MDVPVTLPTTPLLSKVCIVCASQREHTTLFEKWGYPIVRCSQCSLVSTWVKPGFDSTDIYDETYFQGGQKDGYADYSGSEAVLRDEFRKAVRHLSRLGYDQGKLIEVGSAYGFFLSEAQARFQCDGIELSQAAVDFCHGRGLSVVQGTASPEKLGKRPYDVSVMLDCIEHLSNPRETIETLRDSLRPGGALMISTGDWDSLLARTTKSNWRLMTPPQHLYFFSGKTLETLLKSCGFEVIDSARPWKMVPIGLAAYQITRRLGLSIQLPAWLNRISLPVNLFDTVRVIAKRI